MTSPTRGKADVLEQLTSEGLVPVIRAESAAIALRIVEALVDGGIRTLEITMTVPDALGAIRSVADRFGTSVLLGAGTVTSRALAEGAIDAGAEFLVTPCVVPEVIAVARAPRRRRPARRPHTDRSLHGLVAGRRHHQDLPSQQRRRRVVPESVEGSVPSDSALPDGRREPADHRRLREGRRLGGWRRRRAGVEGGDRLGRLRADHDARATVRRRPESRARVTATMTNVNHGATETRRRTELFWATRKTLCVLVTPCSWLAYVDAT